MALSASQIAKVLSAARSLSMTAPPVTVEAFYGSILGLSSIELATLFPKPDPTGLGAVPVSHLTLEREIILRDKCDIPTFVIYESPTGVFISGVCAYYSGVKPIPADYPLDFLNRLQQFRKIRNQLIGIAKGHNLEALAATLLAAACSYGEATRGSGDQGVDAVGTNHLIRIDSIFLDGEIDDSKISPGQKVFILASSKAGLGLAGADVKIISPAHIRELIGGWLIQRSETSVWRNLGIQMLTPLQLLLVTTYRLSSESKSDCNKLGVQVWGIPELIFLICRYGAPAIFSGAGGFSSSQFTKWWEAKESTRIRPLIAA
jgi:hypothetical protein